MKPSKTAVGGGGGRRNWLTGGKENERVPALPKEVEKEKTWNRAPERRSLGEERLRRFRFVSSIKNEF